MVLSVGRGFQGLGDFPSPLPDLPFAEAFVLPPGANSGHLVPAAYGLLHMDAVLAEKAVKAAQKAEKAALPMSRMGIRDSHGYIVPSTFIFHVSHGHP